MCLSVDMLMYTDVNVLSALCCCEVSCSSGLQRGAAAGGSFAIHGATFTLTLTALKRAPSIRQQPLKCAYIVARRSRAG